MPAPTKPMTVVPEESVPEIAKEIADTATRLVKLEIELVKSQALAVVKRAAVGIGLAVAAFIFLLMFIGQVIGTLSELSGQWLGWLIGDVVLLVLTLGLGISGLLLIKKALASGKLIADEMKHLPDLAKETVAHAQDSWRSGGGQR